jgi:hypothetical protein
MDFFCNACNDNSDVFYVEAAPGCILCGGCS